METECGFDEEICSLSAYSDDRCIVVARKIVLPQLTQTKAYETPEDGATSVSLPDDNAPPFIYFTAPVSKAITNDKKERCKTPVWAQHPVPRFPVVLCADGSPWYEANLYLISRFELKPNVNMKTIGKVADDLVAYRRYLDESGIDWLDFPSFKLDRPTYRYSGDLTTAIESGEIAATVAKRRMSAVIRFYRWLMEEQVFKPAEVPWVESDRYIEWKNSYGGTGVLTVTTTDVSIPVAESKDPYAEYIDDDGKLRPLPQNEQEALLTALRDARNTEMMYAHLVALTTGARMQTALTLRVSHVTQNPDVITTDTVRLQAGPGTSINTKRNKQGTLHLPKWLYEKLHIYSVSERARARRRKAKGGNNPNQLLFLSRNGGCLYEPEERRHVIPDGAAKRYHPEGHAVRQFISEKILPAMRRQLNRPTYSYRFHDLRATFGMNFVDAMTPLINSGEMTYTEALDKLKAMMWHTSITTTEVYLKFRNRRAQLVAANEGWNKRLMELAEGVQESARRNDAFD